MTSGCIPLSLKGMSIIGNFCEQTPFWPCREENLSPMTGERGIRSLIWIFCASVSPASPPAESKSAGLLEDHSLSTDSPNILTSSM
jgi:hypothetical protein